MAPAPAGFTLERVVGVGASSVVWLARTHHDPPRRVVLKRLRGHPDGHPPSFALQELTALTSVIHPHVLSPLGVVADPPGVALVLPYVAGGSLRDLLAHRGALQPGEAAAVAVPVAAGLAALHRAGFIHGDVKPENILLSRTGQPVLADAGIARVRGAPPGLGILGTPAYLAPEVASGGAADPGADVFALAATVYELLSGRVPHPGAPVRALELASRGAHDALTRAGGIPTEVSRIVEAGLAADPSRRGAGPEAFAAALVAVLDPTEVRLPGPAPIPDGHERELPLEWQRTTRISGAAAPA